MLRDAILETLQAQDLATAAVARSTGLACPPNCGRCCDNPAIEALPLEMIPLARRLTAEAAAGNTESAAIIAEARNPDSTWDVCAIYDHHGGGKGRCRRYEERPSLCRLFGYSGWLNEFGRPQFSACFHHGAIQPEEVKRASLLTAAQGVSLPLHEEVDEALIATGRQYGVPTELLERKPINEALRLALDWVLPG